METFPHWVSFVQSALWWVSLGSPIYHLFAYFPKYLPLHPSPQFHNYDSLPMSQYHMLSCHPCRYTLNKGSLSPSYSPVHVPHLVSQSHYCSISLISPLLLLSRKPHYLGSCESPSIDVDTSIPEDIPRDICILVSSTSLINSLDHLKGVLSPFWVGFVSRARLQLHYHTIEIHTGY